MNERYIKNSRKIRRKENIKLLNEAVFQLTTSLSEFHPYVLGQNDAVLGFSELLSYVSLFFNGGEKLQLNNKSHHFSIEKTFEKTKKMASLYPNGNVGQYFTAKRIFFGDFIQF
ncbi:hypothetical protein [Rickettsiella massiliensis]|uniref:hypothetical protein n=1 Tax=Rickettsiella massiliensis TaxID=676517 RepID=UPI00029A9D57|nr:hypothetical protein [Rickettsiella massiliensis]